MEVVSLWRYPVKSLQGEPIGLPRWRLTVSPVTDDGDSVTSARDGS